MNRPARSDDPVGVLTVIVRRADPALDPDAVRAAVTSLAATAAQRWNLVRALEKRPSLLTGNGAQAPLRSVLRLVDALAPLGSAQLRQPACPGCGRTEPLQGRVNDLWSCRTCKDRARAVACVRCGALRPPAARDADGGPVCGRCRARDPQVMRTCVGCHQLRPVAARSPDGPRCESCRPQPVLECSVCGRTAPCRISTITGLPHCVTCRRRWARCAGCGQVRQIRSGTITAPRCATCTQPETGRWQACPDCGEETVHGRGCSRCTLRRHLAGILADDTARVRPELQVLLDALAGHERPIAVLRWLRDSGSTPTLRELATGRLPLTHAALDELGDSKVLAHLRAVLVATGALPARDEQLARLEHWITAGIAARPDPDERHLLHRYGTWYLVRRLRARSRGATSYHQAVAVRQRMRFATAFLDALADRGLTLPTATQPDLEAWLSSDTATGRHEVGEFIRWAGANQLTALTLPSSNWAGPAAIQAHERWDQARRLLHDQTLNPGDRVAGLLVLLYAQRAASISRLTLNHLDVTPSCAVRLRLGPEPIELPSPLDQLVTTLAATSREHRAIGDRAASPWLFPGRRPGQPISAYQLGTRLKNLGLRPWQARNAALFDLAMDLPAALLARLLGINVDVAATWQRATAGDWTAYAADIAQRQDPGSRDAGRARAGEAMPASAAHEASEGGTTR